MPDPVIVYRTAGPWGAGKGVNLLAAEVDTNFWEIVQALAAIVLNEPVNISNIAVDGNQMTIFLENGTEFGPFTLPEAAFNFRGAWEDGTSYARYDFFTANDGLYLVLQGHDTDSESTFNPNAANMIGPFYRLVMPFPNIYDIGFFFPGKPGSGIETSSDGPEAMFAFRCVRDFYLLAALPLSRAELRLPPGADTVFPIYKNDSQIGSIVFDTESSDPEIGVMTLGDDTQFTAGDWLRVLRPEVLDEDARDLTVTFAGTKGTL